MIDPNEMTASGPQSGPEHRDHGRSDDAGHRRPYSDAGYLYEIPRVRPEDPPMRDWWVDDDGGEQTPER